MSSLLSKLVDESLPTLSSLGHLTIGKAEVLVTAPGFEDRTLGIPSHLSPASSGSAILLDYRPALATNQLQRVSQYLRERGISISPEDVIEYDRFDPNDFTDRFRTRLEYLRSTHVLIDISTMSKLAVMLVLNACFALSLTVTVLYTEAKSYAPSEHEFEEARNRNAVHRPSLQVFTGVYGVVRISCLASVAMQGQPTAALAFMSFNDALTQVLLNTVYPARLFLINCRPPQHSWRERATAWIHDNVRREWEADNPVVADGSALDGLPARAASTLDYRETVSILLGLYWQLSSTHRVLLAPAGSKMQAIGCFLVKALHPDIHIEYPSPEGFAPEYSSGIGPKWKLEFGNIASCVNRFSEKEKDLFLKLRVPD